MKAKKSSAHKSLTVGVPARGTYVFLRELDNDFPAKAVGFVRRRDLAKLREDALHDAKFDRVGDWSKPLPKMFLSIFARGRGRRITPVIRATEGGLAQLLSRYESAGLASRKSVK